MDDTKKTIMARITGRVQGVAFRAWTRDEAIERGLSGWVRNEADGSVTAMLQGPPSAVDAMTNRLRHGPSAARVTDVHLEEPEPRETFHDFSVRR